MGIPIHFIILMKEQNGPLQERGLSGKIKKHTQKSKIDNSKLENLEGVCFPY